MRGVHRVRCSFQSDIGTHPNCVVCPQAACRPIHTILRGGTASALLRCQLGALSGLLIMPRRWDHLSGQAESEGEAHMCQPQAHSARMARQRLLPLLDGKHGVGRMTLLEKYCEFERFICWQ